VDPEWFVRDPDSSVGIPRPHQIFPIFTKICALDDRAFGRPREIGPDWRLALDRNRLGPNRKASFFSRHGRVRRQSSRRGESLEPDLITFHEAVKKAGPANEPGGGPGLRTIIYKVTGSSVCSIRPWFITTMRSGRRHGLGLIVSHGDTGDLECVMQGLISRIAAGPHSAKGGGA
jgi:hypothetical protein